MTKKQLVDNYLSKNAEKVEMWRNTKDFSWKEVAEDLGNKSVDGEYIRSRYKWFRKKGGEFIKTPLFIPSIDEKKYSFTDGKEDKSKGTKEFTFTADNIPTEEEIISHFNIDLKKYRIVQIWHKTTPGGKYSISVNLQTLKGNETIEINTDFLSKLSLIKPIEFPLPKEVSDLPNACLLIPKQDSHWNKLDIDGNNSIDERFSTFSKIMFNQLEKVIKLNSLEKIIYIVGSDEFNSEWTIATTKGTPQQNILNYQEAFEKVSEFSITFIKMLAYYTKNVDVILLNGNHDHNVSWHLANLLKHVFSTNPHVTVNTELVNTKLLEYKSNLILLNHGDEMKPKDLATKFPIIAKDKWSQFDNYFVITGDKHHEQAYDYNGIRTYQVPQLSKAKSLWDDKKGHICSKAELVTFLFEEDGLSNILRKEIK